MKGWEFSQLLYQCSPIHCTFIKEFPVSRLKKSERVISVGLVGAGAMGKGLFRQFAMTPGIQCVALVDLNMDRAIRCTEEMVCPYQIIDSTEAMHLAIENGDLAICQEGLWVAGYEGIEVLLEASSSISTAGSI